MLLKIDILAKLDDSKRCDEIERLIKMASYSTKVQVQLNRTNQFARFSHLAINPAQTPIIIINGGIEFVGRKLDIDSVRQRLMEIAYKQESF